MFLYFSFDGNIDRIIIAATEQRRSGSWRHTLIPYQAPLRFDSVPTTYQNKRELMILTVLVTVGYKTVG